MDQNTSSQRGLAANAAWPPIGLGSPSKGSGYREASEGELPAGPGTLPAGPDSPPAGLEGLACEVAGLAADDLDQLGDALLADQVLAMRHLGDQFEAAWLRRLAAPDARGAAGAEVGACAMSTTGWLRATTRMSPAAAGQRVRTARALHRGPLAATARALAQGDVSYAHAAVLADATGDLPPPRVAEAEPVLVDAARRLDPGGLRRLAAHLRDLVDPDGAEERGRARLDRRGLWLSATFEGMVAVKGLLDAEAGEAAQAALAPLARPTGPDDERSAAQRRADALEELARQALQAGHLPDSGGLRPHLTITADLVSLLAGQGGVGGSGGWGTALPPETVRRLACDAAVTRAIVHRHPDQTSQDGAAGHGYTHGDDATDHGHTTEGGLAAELRAAITLLPPPLGAPTQLLDLGRATRAVSPALRRALVLRDGGCLVQGCDRPPPWTDAHHLHHWLHGGPTSLDNLILLCRVHHRAVHEEGWRLHRDPTSGRVSLAPPARRGHSPPAA
jgi:hypothetical protein